MKAKGSGRRVEAGPWRRKKKTRPPNKGRRSFSPEQPETLDGHFFRETPRGKTKSTLSLLSPRSTKKQKSAEADKARSPSEERRRRKKKGRVLSNSSTSSLPCLLSYSTTPPLSLSPFSSKAQLPPPSFFLAAALVTLPVPSFFSTALMTPTATVWRMSRTAKRPSGG